MSQTVNGGGGIPREGRERAYATELWLDGPSAFWLHPEGPLSDTTPDEWRAKQPEPRVSHWAPISSLQMASQNAYATALMQSQFAIYQNALANQQGQYAGLSGILGFRLF